MAHRLLIALLVALCSLGVVQAQDTPPEYKLRVPGADEYLQVIVTNADALKKEFISPFYENSIEKITGAVFHLFPDVTQTSFDKLYDTYTTLEIGKEDFYERDAWVKRMLERWIYDQQINLSQTAELEFKDFFVRVIPRDFDADGTDEYLLDITKGTRIDRRTNSCLESEIVDYLVVKQSPDGYQFIETGLPWKGYAPNGRYSFGNGGLVELRFEDVNADGLPEWVVLVGGEISGGPGMGYADGGGLIVLGWRDNGLKYLIPSAYQIPRISDQITTDFFSAEGHCGGPFPITVKWDFKNIDTDPSLEILQEQSYSDNWLCARTKTKVFDWSAQADSYTYLETNINYADDTQNCVQREAEEMMWAGNYTDAIPRFERALSLKTHDLTQSDNFNYARSLNQYLRARLALAYIMTEQGDKAMPLLENLWVEPIEEKPIESFIATLRNALDNHSSPLLTCIDAYNGFNSNPFKFSVVPQIRVGFTGDDLYYYNNPYRPQYIGCDAPSMIKSVLDDAAIPISVSPVSYLSSLGINSLQSIEIFATGDLQSSWLVWPDVTGVELLFTPVDDHYAVAVTDVDSALQSTDMDTIKLPSGEMGIALISPFFAGYNNTSLIESAYSTFSGSMQDPISCPLSNGTSSSINALNIWQLKDGELVSIFSQWQCGTKLDGIFNTSNSERILDLLIVDCGDGYGCSEAATRQLEYEWSEEQATYIDNHISPTETPQTTATLEPTATPRPYPQYFSVLAAFNQSDFNAVVGMPPQTFILDKDREANDQLGDFYLRALALESLNRPAEALAEYVAIYTTAPDSAWGKLAALHLECVANCPEITQPNP